MNADEKIRRGNEAERLLNNTLLIEAFSTLKAEYINGWENTGSKDTDARERLWQAYQIVGKVRTHLITVADSGKIEKKQIEDLAKRAEPKRSRFAA